MALTCEHNNDHNPCESPGMPCEPFRIGIIFFFRGAAAHKLQIQDDKVAINELLITG